MTILAFMMPVLEDDYEGTRQWTTFVSDACGFSVDIPEGYEVESFSSQSDGDSEPGSDLFDGGFLGGGQAEDICLVGAHADGVTYMVLCTDVRDFDLESAEEFVAQTEEFLALLSDPAISASLETVRLKKNRGVQLEIAAYGEDSVPGLQMIMRAYLVNDTLYTLAAGYFEGDGSRKQIRKFLRSFKLLN
jgi:hypothetical protein